MPRWWCLWESSLCALDMAAVSVRVGFADVHFHLGILVLVLFVARSLLSLCRVRGIHGHCFCRSRGKACDRLHTRLFWGLFALRLGQLVRAVELRNGVGLCPCIGDVLKTISRRRCSVEGHTHHVSSKE